MNKDPFDPIMEELSAFIELARDKAPETFNDAPLMKDINKRLDFLEEAIMMMGRVTDEEVAKQGLNNEDLVKTMFPDRDKLPKKDKRVVEKTLQLSKDAFGLKFALTMAQLQLSSPKVKNFEKGKVGKKQTNKRKAKFKKAQGDKSWKRI